MFAVRRLVLTLALTVPGALAAPAPASAPAIVPAAAPVSVSVSVPVAVVGDSLAVGTKPFLDGLTPGYSLSWDVRNGRTTPQGMAALRALLRVMRPQAVVVSLGTNDGPSARRFADRLRRILAAVPPDTCVIWPTIVRPRRKGAAHGLNRVLRRYAARDDRLTLIDWRGAVRRGQVRLPDGLHPDRAGYQRRSAMVATALERSCGPPTPAPPASDGDGSGGAVGPSA